MSVKKGREMKHVTLLMFLCALLLGSVVRVEAASLKVSPARFIVHDVKPGKLYDIHAETGLRITIYNDDDKARTWTLSTHRPSERGRWEKGYAEIPDARWCRFDMNEITIPPNSRGYAKLYLEIPDGEKYYNQHWVVTLGIGGRAEGGIGIGLAVNVRMQIETESRSDLKTRPDGLIGLKPSMVRFENVSPGTNQKTKVVLYNNDTVAHSYTTASLFEDEATKRKSYLTSNYSAMPDTARLGLSDEPIEIEPGGSAALDLEVKIPDDANNFGKRWEDILLVQPDEGRAGFLRIRVETTEMVREE